MSRVRVACVGTGFIAGRHLSALSQMRDVKVVAVSDAVRDRAQVTAERFGARAHDDGWHCCRRRMSTRCGCVSRRSPTVRSSRPTSCGDLVRRHVVTDVVPFDEGPQFMTDLADRRRSTIQALFAVGA